VTQQVGTPQPRRKSFAEQSMGDLVRSLVLLLLVVGGVYWLGSLFTGEEPRGVRAVDYSALLADAREAADYPVAEPTSLGAEWVPTSVDLSSGAGTVRWHLGYLSPRREYVGLEQGDGAARVLTGRYITGMAPGGTVSVDGVPWRLYTGETDSALVRRGSGATTVVVGTAPAAVLTEFAASLRPAP
jgi:Protein of unknown function (DUF4245)